MACSSLVSPYTRFSDTQDDGLILQTATTVPAKLPVTHQANPICELVRLSPGVEQGKIQLSH